MKTTFTRLDLDDGTTGYLDSEGNIWLEGDPIVLTDNASDEEVARLREAIMRYRWKTPEDGMRFLGWLPVGISAGALCKRPHLLLLDPSGTGESWLLDNVIMPLLGNAVERMSNEHEKVIKQMKRYSSLPVVVNAAESNTRWVRKFIDFHLCHSYEEKLNQRTDPRSRDDNLEYRPRFSGLLCTTKIPHMKPLTRTRLCLAELEEATDNWTKVEDEILDALQCAVSLRSKMIRDVAQIVTNIDNLRDEFVCNGTHNPFFSAALSVGWEWWGGEDIVHAVTVDDSDLAYHR